MKKIAGVVPAGILDQHVAVLGKTGSGKTSTAKLLVEHVVANGSRVCVLDPIKSDWWGLTSSADGKKAGLPFHILGGPRGHVPLHESAGAAIAEIVANGSLPLSVIDMADFKPGGQAQFFTHFAPTLLRKMRGVVYLVLEEAHLFAPKERSGIGEENMSIHWAKMLATAGRSKGVRLILVTQRTQALHNALLGSCDTMLAHRLTAPADQKPVIQWLQANASKDALEQVTSSLSSLKTGDAWVCSGEVAHFERVHFPRISTYDNTATPTGDGEIREVKTAPVDQEKLRAIIGDAVEEAKANDPKELKKQLLSTRAELAKAQQLAAKAQQASPEKAAIQSTPALTDADRALIEKLTARLAELEAKLTKYRDAAQQALDDRLFSAFATFIESGKDRAIAHAEELKAILESASVKKLLEKLNGLSVIPAAKQTAKSGTNYSGIIPVRTQVQRQQAVTGSPRRQIGGQTAGQTGELSLVEPEQRILDSLAWWRAAGIEQPTRQQVAFGARYTVNGHFNNTLGALNSKGFVTYPQRGMVSLTEDGIVRSNKPEAPASRDGLIEMVLNVLRDEPQVRIFKAMLAQEAEMVTREELAASCQPPYTVNGHFNNTLGSLKSIGVLDYPQRGYVGFGDMFNV